MHALADLHSGTRLPYNFIWNGYKIWSVSRIFMTDYAVVRTSARIQQGPLTARGNALTPCFALRFDLGLGFRLEICRVILTRALHASIRRERLALGHLRA